MIKCRILTWAAHVALMEEGRNAFKILTGKPPDPRFAGSNSTEVDGFFQDVKNLSTSPPGRRTLSREIGRAHV